MAINKVEFDGQTLIDLTGDTVTQQDVLNGKSFHSADGVQRSGTASIPVSDVTVDGTSVVTNGVAEVVTDNLAPTVTEASSRTNLAVGDSLKTIIGKIKKFFSDLKTVAFTGSYNDLSNKPTIPAAQVNSDWNASSGVAKILNKPSLATVATSGSYNDLSNKPTIPDISTKVSKSGDTMTGTLNMQTENNVCINLRPGNADWYDTISTQTAGNEAIVFATKKGDTSWIFINGEDSVTNHANNRWQSLTPALQIKNNKVAIGKLIANNANLTYPLEVNGDVSATKFRGALIGNADTATSASYVKDYNNSTPTKFGYSTSGVAQSAATWLGAWDTTVSGEYRLRAVKQADLKVAYATSAGSATDSTARTTANAALPKAGGDMTGSVNFKSGKGINFYNSANNNFSDISTSSNGTTFLRSSHGWINLCTNNQVQCRNFGDSAWVNIAAANISSSRRFKENIKDLTEEEAKKLLDIRTVTFDFKETYAPSSDWEHERFNQSGVIAEEVLDIYPTLVRFSNYEEPEKEPIPTFVEYSHFVPYLIKMVQMQQKEIDQLKAEVAELKR